mgnify:FL=1|jgi:predicted negative regulator of RcsB-dependent stress response
MKEINNKKNIITNFQNFILSNARFIIISTLSLIILFISFQTYNYFSIQAQKKTSINFFNSIENNNEIIENLNDIKNDDNIFSILSSLKLIEKSNEKNNFGISNELYKEIILSDKLDDLYKSSISAHASYTLINASYLENTINYIDDISFYIGNINDNLESFFSIKKELEYLLIVMEVDIIKSEYKNNIKAQETYDSIYNSSLISSSVKERVKKIHEYQLYK